MNILTFDTEEWYNYAQMNGRKGNFLPEIDRVQNELLDKLDKHGIKATFFVLGVVARQYPYIVKEIVARGHDVGCHSDIHQKLWKLYDQQMFEDTHKAIDSIEQLINKKVISYRAPAFSIGKENVHFLDILAENGIEIDCSIFPGNRDFGGFPEFSEGKPCMISHNGIELKEMPISLTTLFGKKLAYSGGGYFRLLPYLFIKRIVQDNAYNMMYMHVHDFNAKQKRILSTRYIKNYYGNRWSMDKLERLLTDFSFVNVAQAVESISWQNQNKIQL